MNKVNFSKVLTFEEFFTSELEYTDFYDSYFQTKQKAALQKLAALQKVVFGTPAIFERIISVVLNNVPKEFLQYRLVSKKWKENTDNLLKLHWPVKDEYFNELFEDFKKSGTNYLEYIDIQCQQFLDLKFFDSNETGELYQTKELEKESPQIRCNKIFLNHLKNRDILYKEVFSIDKIFKSVLSFVLENKPREFLTYGLVNKQWLKNTHHMLQFKWFELIHQLPKELDHIKTAMENIENGNPDLFVLKKCQKLEKILIPSFVKKKLMDVPLTVEGYDGLQKEVEDRTLEVIWKIRIKPFLVNYFEQFGNLAPLQMQEMPASNIQAGGIRMFLHKTDVGKVQPEVEVFEFDKDLGGYTFIPKYTFIPAEICPSNLATVPMETKSIFLMPAPKMPTMLMPASNFEAKAIRQILCYIEFDQQLLANVEVLHLNNLGLTLIPAEIGHFKKLKKLDLSNNKISKIEKLKNLLFLEEFLINNNNISQIEGLDDLTKLKELGLGSNLISKIEHLDHQMGLKKLALYHNQITKIGEGLNPLKELESVCLDKNLIEDINKMELPKLRVLRLNGNSIVNITNLNLLSNLQMLSLNDNRITHITDLNLPNLEMLLLKNNMIKKITNLTLPCLRELNIDNNPIELKINNLRGMRTCIQLIRRHDLKKLQMFNGRPVKQIKKLAKELAEQIILKRRRDSKEITAMEQIVPKRRRDSNGN